MKAFVEIPKIDAGLITVDDYKYFKDIKIFPTEDKRIIVTFVYEDGEYLTKWLERVDGKSIIDPKLCLRLSIEEKVGDTKDRIADCFKMVHMLFIMLIDVYKTLPNQDKISSPIKEVFESIRKKLDSGEDVFNLQLKESYLAEIEKLIKREETVVKDIKTYTE